MCLSSPDIPAPPPPPQEMKQPDAGKLAGQAKQNRSAMAGGSLLTGPSGVANVATGKTTLLGG